MVDPFENKASRDTLTFNFIDVKQKVIVEALNMLNHTGRCNLQAVNFDDRVFLIEREHLQPKLQKLSIYEHIRGSGELTLLF